MTTKTRLTINMIVVLLLGIGMITWLVSNVIGSGLFNDDWTVTADFKSSGGVFTNQQVTYRGVLVGSVGELSLNDDGVDVELNIEEQWRGKIPSSVVAKVQSKSAVGEQFVNLTPRGEGSGALRPGDEIVRADTELPVDFQSLLSALDRVLRDVPPEELANVTSTLADGIGGRGDDIATILESLGDLSDAFAGSAPAQQRLLTSAPQAGSEFLRTKENFAAAIQAADEVFAGIGDEPEELAAFFRANDRFARSAESLFERRGADLAAGIDGLNDLVDFQLENRDAVIQGLEHIPEFLQAVEDASVPWRAADGSTYYRLRVGLVWDNDDPTTWPCKYVQREGYERLPHVRTSRDPNTKMKCIPSTVDASGRAMRALVNELEAWARANPVPENDPVNRSISAGIEAAVAIPLDVLVAPEEAEPAPAQTLEVPASPSP